MSVYYVYQGETYEEERKGGYVWSPKLTKSGGKNAGYSMMTYIKKDDFILHMQRREPSRRNWKNCLDNRDAERRNRSGFCALFDSAGNPAIRRTFCALKFCIVTKNITKEP